jgi:hypothetical protein
MGDNRNDNLVFLGGLIGAGLSIVLLAAFVIFSL